jgi:uncharacterized protein (DUF2384 family)
MRAVKRKRDPDETKDLKTLIAEVIPDSERWMDTPNRHFGARKPKDLIGTEFEGELRNLVRAVKYGMFS